MKITIILLILTVTFFPPLCSAEEGSEIYRKMPAMLADLLASKTPVNYAKDRGIGLKDGAVKVIVEVGENSSPAELAVKYSLAGFKVNKNLLISYVKLDTLKELCKDPSVIFVRMPARLLRMG
ncbi:MAG: hypothetical protein NTY34_02600 [Candidatus Omnitrophica bacterium]|nr:hypothetical protein [Candidatus Omnitrophota bacterium]